MVSFICMCGLDGLLLTSGKNIMPIAPLKILTQMYTGPVHTFVSF